MKSSLLVILTLTLAACAATKPQAARRPSSLAHEYGPVDPRALVRVDLSDYKMTIFRSGEEIAEYSVFHGQNGRPDGARQCSQDRSFPRGTMKIGQVEGSHTYMPFRFEMRNVVFYGKAKYGKSVWPIRLLESKDRREGKKISGCGSIALQGEESKKFYSFVKEIGPRNITLEIVE